MTGPLNTRILDAKNAPFFSQVGPCRSEREDPRNLQEVVARIASRDRPVGKCKNSKKLSLCVNNAPITADLNTSSSYVAKSRPMLPLAGKYEHVNNIANQRKNEPRRKVIAQIDNITGNREDKSMVGYKLVERSPQHEDATQ